MGAAELNSMPVAVALCLLVAMAKRGSPCTVRFGSERKILCCWLVPFSALPRYRRSQLRRIEDLAARLLERYRIARRGPDLQHAHSTSATHADATVRPDTHRGQTPDAVRPTPLSCPILLPRLGQPQGSEAQYPPGRSTADQDRESTLNRRSPSFFARCRHCPRAVFICERGSANAGMEDVIEFRIRQFMGCRIPTLHLRSARQASFGGIARSLCDAEFTSQARRLTGSVRLVNWPPRNSPAALGP